MSHRALPQVREHGAPRQALEGGLADKTLGSVRQHDVNDRAGLEEPAGEVCTLVRRYAAGDDQQDAAPIKRPHARPAFLPAM